MKLDPRKIEIPDRATAEILRRMTSAQRLEVANRMWISARNAVEHILMSEHPDWSADEILRETAKRMLHGAV